MHGSTFIQSTLLIKLVSLIWVDKIVVNALSIKEELVATGIPLKRIIFLPNCVEISHISSPDERNNILEDKELIVCTIGNLRKNKNHLFFVKIMGSLIKSGANVKGWIVGQPVPDEPQLENVIRKKIHSMGLDDKITLLGFQNNTTELLKKSSIYVFTSLSEGTPNTILEAMASGVIVFCFDTSSMSEMIEDDISGFKITPFDEEEFAKRILNVVFSRKRNLVKVAKDARIRVEKTYSKEKNFNEWRKILLFN